RCSVETGERDVTVVNSLPKSGNSPVRITCQRGILAHVDPVEEIIGTMALLLFDRLGRPSQEPVRLGVPVELAQGESKIREKRGSIELLLCSLCRDPVLVI